MDAKAYNELEVDVRLIEDELATVAEDIDDMDGTLTGLRKRLDDLMGDLADAKARLAAVEPEPSPDPETDRARLRAWVEASRRA